jgi:hypothetical protein
MELDRLQAELNKVPGFLETRFDERQFKQIQFSLLYASGFAHGADGHNNMLIIAKLVGIIRELTEARPKPA